MAISSSTEGKALASHGDDRDSDSQCAVFNHAFQVDEGKIVPGKADESFVGFRRGGVRRTLLEVVPCPAVEGSQRPSDQSRAGVVRFDGDGFRWRYGVVLRVEFSERGVDVFDVELHLQCYATFLVKADYLKLFVLRRPRTQICSA